MILYYTPPVSELHFIGRKLHGFTRYDIKQHDLFYNVPDLSAVCSRIHNDRSADGSGYTRSKLKTRKGIVVCGLCDFREHRARTRSDRVAAYFNMIAALTEADYAASVSAVGNDQVASVSDHGKSLILRQKKAYNFCRLLQIGGCDKYIRTSADPKRRMSTHILIQTYVIRIGKFIQSLCQSIDQDCATPSSTSFADPNIPASFPSVARVNFVSRLPWNTYLT